LPGHSVKGTRRKGRELALQALYQIEITSDSSVAAVDLFLQHFEGNAAAKEFARRLVSGVVSQSVEIDRLIAQCTENWKLARLAKVDLVVLRMATYELVFCPDIPSRVSLDEAIEIGKRFGSPTEFAQHGGAIDMGRRKIRIDLDRSTKTRKGFSVTIEFVKGKAKSVVGEGKPRRY